MTAEVPAGLADEYLRMVRTSWLVSRAWNRLHFAVLTAGQALELVDEGSLDGPVRLACGRMAAYVCIPGVITRMGGQRCGDCCRATGLPPGKGSPRNDRECRAILGLD